MMQSKTQPTRAELLREFRDIAERAAVLYQNTGEAFYRDIREQAQRHAADLTPVSARADRRSAR